MKNSSLWHRAYIENESQAKEEIFEMQDEEVKQKEDQISDLKNKTRVLPRCRAKTRYGR